MSDGYVTDPYDLADGDPVYVAEPIPVTIEAGDQRTAEFGSTMSWSIPVVGSGTPVQILPRRYRRYEAYIFIVSLGSATAVFFNYRIDALQGTNPQGFQMQTTGIMPPWKNQQPLYAIAIGTPGPAIVSVIDNAYAETRPEQFERP